MNDPYARSAEYIDIMIAEAWDAFGPAWADALKGTEAVPGTIVDLGAGSGRGVRAVCAALPGDSPILAVNRLRPCGRCCSPGSTRTRGCADASPSHLATP